MASPATHLATGDAAACIVCASGANVVPLVEKDGWPLFRCRSCDHVFVYPAPSDEELAELYSFESGYQKEASARAVGAAPPLKYRARVERLSKHRSSGSLLDVGCSHGSFLRAAREHGFEAHGVELNPDTADLAREAGFPVETGSLQQVRLPKERFDVVHLGDVIEHVSDPASLLEQVRRVLKRDGVLVVATPNHDAFFPRAGLALHRIGIPWSHATPPHHLHQFSTRSLQRLLEKTGFGLIEASYAPAGLGYELRATGAPSRLKRAVAARDALGVVRSGVASLAAAVIYPPLWGAARLASEGQPDADMTLIATRVD